MINLDNLRLTKCLCGTSHGDLITNKDNRTIIECLKCGLIRTLEIAKDYSDFYTEGNRYHLDRENQIPYRERYAHDIEVGKSRLNKLFNLIPRHRINSVLDVGCANGGFLTACQIYAHMRIIEGLEVNPLMAQWAKKTTQKEVHTSWDSIDHTYDLITYHDVIEHIEDPVEELTKAVNHLSPGGILIIDTPDANDPRRIELENEWHHLKPLEHLWFFSPETFIYNVFETSILANELELLSTDTPILGKIVLYFERKEY